MAHPFLLPSDPAAVRKAAEVILQGGLVAFPTETFYGLGADGLDQAALEKIFRVKGRPEINPLPLLIADRNWLPGLVKEVPPPAELLMERFWPGPLTLVFEASPHLPSLLTGGTGKVGLRISSHPVARELVRAAGRPVTATSANLSGRSAACSADEVLRTLGPRVDLILDGGRTTGGPGSTVLDVSQKSLRVIREGAIPREELAPFLKDWPF